MSFLAAIFEGVWRAFLGLVRSALLAQGLALACALIAVPWVGAHGAPPWLGDAVRACLQIAATFLATGVLVGLARRLPPPNGEGVERRAWPWLLALSLVGLPLFAYASSAELVELWREILARLDGIGAWAETQRSGPWAGFVALPLLLALYVPALEVGAALALTVLPLGLLPLLLARRSRFPRLYLALVVCQAGLLLASVFAADGFARLSSDAAVRLRADGDFELRALAGELEGAAQVLAASARSFVAPWIGYAAWLVLLVPPRRAGRYFSSTTGIVAARS